MKAKIKELRIQIDGLAQPAKELNPPMNVVKLKDIPSGMDWESFEKLWYTWQRLGLEKYLKN